VSTSLSQTTVLVVDDDDEVRTTYAALLASRSYNTAQARSGDEALAYCLKHAAPSLIVLDLEMPGMGGWALLKVLHCYRRFAEIPVLIVSGSELDEGARAAYPYLSKPVQPDELIRRVGELLASKSPSFG
jgi:putative two-component system response regulator